MSHSKAESRREWATMWPMPLTGMLGIVAVSAFSYSYGVFMLSITEEFGWTRAQFSSAYMLQALVGLISAPIAGRLVDRFGPRRVALGAMLPFLIGMSMLALADGSLRQWQVLCAFYAIGASGLAPTVWVAAVTRRFDASRGLAMGVVLAGTGVGTGLWPLAATGAIALVGWRLALPLMAIVGVAIVLPLTFAFIRDRADAPLQTKVDRPKPPPLWPLLRSRTFIRLISAGCLFVSVAYGLTLHLVPMLTANGFNATLAASAAAIAGIATVVGRIVTGWLLDRFPTRLVGMIAFLLPIVELLCLWQGNGSVALSLIGVAILGFTAGAESDVLVYFASRRFDKSVFASVYALIGASFTLAAGTGPWIAGAVFDKTGNYSAYYLLCIPIALVATALIASIPNQKVVTPTAVPAQ